jgi:hypothetical protein
VALAVSVVTLTVTCAGLPARESQTVCWPPGMYMNSAGGSPSNSLAA